MQFKSCENMNTEQGDIRCSIVWSRMFCFVR